MGQCTLIHVLKLQIETRRAYRLQGSANVISSMGDRTDLYLLELAQ
jgi:hypothetical protein